MFRNILIQALLLGSSYGTKCPDVLSFRSQQILDDFDPKGLSGLWYEAAHIDLAQVGSSCQTMNFTQADDKGLTCDFKVRYGPAPFTMTELYAPQDEVAHYIKTAKVPGGKLLRLDTVVVDAAMECDECDGTYDDLILFSCIDAVDTVPVIELNIVTREKFVD